MVVNKEYNFAVIDLGSNNGLSVEDVISVYESGRYIGDVKIEKLQSSMSAVTLLDSGLKDKFSVGKIYTFKVK